VKKRGIVLHTVGVKGDTSMAAIRKYHVEHNGWRDAGYHFGIRKSGRVEPGRALALLGAHTEGANDTIGVCVYGNGDTEAWTLAQWSSVIDLCVSHCRANGWSSEDVHGHREAPARLGAKPTAKTCPGRLVDMNEVRARVAAVLALPSRLV
jgi:hypothetical protein